MIKKIFAILLPVVLFAGAANADFYIKNYEVYISVDTNKQASVHELIEVEFTSPSHGIYRDIPVGNGDIDSIWASETYTQSLYGNGYRIKIGNPNVYVEGTKTYRIQYHHKIYDGKPEFYYNIIGTDWQVPIEKVRFTVAMPKAIKAENVGISIGTYGTKGFTDGAEYYVKDNMVYGTTTTRTLQPHEAITLKVNVDDDYFNNLPNPWKQKTLSGLLIFVLSSVLIWFLYGRDEHITPIVSFNPPKEINAITAEQIYNEKTTKKSLVAMLVELANAGCLKIAAQDKYFSLQKLKDYEGKDENMADFMEAIFESQTIVSNEDLKKSKHFYRTCKRILSDFNSKSKRQKFYEETSLSFVSNAFMALCCAGTLLLTFLIAANYQPYLMFEYVPIVVFASIYAYLCISKGQYFQAVIMIFFFAGAGVNIFVIDGFVKLFKNSPELLWQLAGGIVCTIITATCFVQMAKPNHKGRWYKAQLLGLKKFIEVAEKPRLEKMVEKNPEYFYKVLPYAYILGVSDKWIKKLEDVLPAEATQNYQYNNFNSFARGFSSAAAPSVENGGIKRRSSSGGGGFSGGGFGGGGGGSW